MLCCAVLCRDEPRKLLTVLTAADHPLAQHAESAAALQELALLFDYLEVGVLHTLPCSFTVVPFSITLEPTCNLL